MPTLGIFAKRPVPGAVKTRLATAIGAEAAARFYEVSLRTLLARMSRIFLRRVIGIAESGSTAHREVNSESMPPHPSPLPLVPCNGDDTTQLGGEGDESCRLSLCLSDLHWFRQFEGYELWPQPAGDLGQKLTAWFDFACSTDDRVLVIGSDSPTLPLEFITQAVTALDACDCVIGPALDGGYYLLGLRCPAPQLFNGIEWSTPRVLEQTLTRAAEQGLRVTLLPKWNDVDEVADLAVLRDQLHELSADPVWDQLRREVD